MDYYESAEDIVITYKRAMSELARHGITDTESMEAFDTECWAIYSDGSDISAHHVLNWLGY